MAPLQSVLRSPKQAAWVRSVLTLDLLATHVAANRRLPAGVPLAIRKGR